MCLHMTFYLLSLLQHLPFSSGTRYPANRVVLLASVPGSVVSRPLVWRGSLHPDHLEILGMEDGSYWKGIAFINNTNFLQ